VHASGVWAIVRLLLAAPLGCAVAASWRHRSATVQDTTVPPERYQKFERVMEKSKLAHTNFQEMPRSAQRQFVELYFEARKEETCIKRVAKLIDLLEQRRGPM